jgi:hypothetical protein
MARRAVEDISRARPRAVGADVPLPDQSAVRREWTGGGWGEPATAMYSSSGREVALLATLSRANALLNPSD